MSAATPLAAAVPFETEATAIGNQTLVPGVAPITPAQRLSLRAKVHSLSRTNANRKSAALLAWLAALKIARLSARNTASQEPR